MRSLITRHLKVYFRDRWAVFFSFLSVMIILVLFLVFLNMMQVNSLPEQLRDTNEGNYLVYAWILSGVLMVSTVTTPLGFLGLMVNDLEAKTIHDFYASPLSRSKVVASYLIGAIIVALTLSTFNLIIGLGVLYYVSGYLLPLLDILLVILAMTLTSLLFASLFYFIVSLLKTNQSHSTLSTLIGTLIGFFAGIYVPIGSFGRGLITFLSSLPFMQGAVLIRHIYMQHALDTVFMNAEGHRQAYERFFGLELILNNQMISLSWVIVILLAWTILFTGLSLFRVHRFKL